MALMRKAARACISARLLLGAGDADGACNRAYYAMFDAAKAVLLEYTGADAAALGKTHSGLITVFGLHLVKPGIVAVELGRALNRAEEVRLIADYKGDSIDALDAEEMVASAEVFVAAMQIKFGPD